jgi:hypothetical protein
MAEKVNLKIMKCPTCGASLKAANGTDTITCVYCGNSIVPVTETTPVAQNETVSGGFSGVLKVEGIKTSSSALAYIEQFYEEYDWEAFAYAQTLSVAEIDKLASSLKVSSADDKNTWFVCFKAISVPFTHKIAGCKEILSSVIEEYKKDNLDAYSKFDAYKRIASMISARKNSIVANLEKISANAAKYGASSTEVNGLNADIDSIKNLSVVDVYSDIENIPEIKTFINEKNTKIADELAAEGINAEIEYNRAKVLIEEKNYVEALNILLSLKGYSDSNVLADKIDKYYLISDVLEIEGNLYYFKKGSSEHDTLNLYPTVDGKISEKAIIKSIGKIITNYADILYYFDGNDKLQKYNLSTNTKEKIYDNSFNKKAIYVYGRKVFLLANKNDEYSSQKRDLIELCLTTGEVRTVLEDIKEIVSFTDNKMIYTVVEKIKNDSDYESSYKTLTNIINIDTMNIVELGTKKVSIEGFINDYVVYTQESPNNYNKNLYIKALNSDEPEKLVEQNIFKFCDIIADKLFYYIGNSKNQSLININCDGSERKEWPLYISEVLFEQGGWLYFIRKAGYNSILCKSKLDGSKFSIIAADIEEFIEIKNGYLYYINDVSTLVKVRMDGSNLQELCDDVETVLSVKEDKIIFVSIDDRITIGEYAQSTTKIVKSIYAVDFSGGGKIKLAYNIKSAKEYDENTVYYVAAQEIKSSYDRLEKQLDVLYKLDVKTNQVDKLLDLEVQAEEPKLNGFAIAMIIMAIAAFLALIGFAAEAPGLGIFGLLIAIPSLVVGIGIKASENES